MTWPVANALDADATSPDFAGVLRAVTPQVGGPRGSSTRRPRDVSQLNGTCNASAGPGPRRALTNARRSRSSFPAVRHRTVA
jgi:hypothetical protein